MFDIIINEDLMLDFIKTAIHQFLLDYKSGGFMSVISYVILTIFTLFFFAFGIVLVKNLISQLMLKKSNQKVTHAVVISKRVIRRPFFMKLFGETKDRYIVVLRSKKFNQDLEYEDVDFYAHSQLNKKYEATFYEIYVFGKFNELRVTEVKYLVN